MRNKPKLILAYGKRPSVKGVSMFGGRYTVYKNGVIVRESVRAMGRSGCVRILPPIILQPFLFKKYYHVNINLKGGIWFGLRPVHRLVCEAFHGPPPPPKMDVNHRDGNKLNNSARNLEWATRKQNQQHAADNGLKPVGEKSHLAKIKAADAQKIIGMRGRISQSRLAAQFGVSQTQISRIQRRKQWKQLKTA